MNIVVCGDICPTEDTVEYFKKGAYQNIFNNTIPVLKAADVLVGNLEFPLITNGIGVKKTGPILKGDDNFIEIFKKINFSALSLANNHIKDCGVDGVLNTLKICKDSNIATFGAGKNIEEAKKPLIIEKNGWKIGLMSFAEHEFNAAYNDEAGANLLDVYSDFDLIKDFKKEVDYLIILYHGGIEYYRYPSPLLKQKCRKLVESGADFVTCQHSHVIGTEEDYLNGKILYGQGNTVFGYRKNSNSWNEGLLVNISLSIKGCELEYLPIKISEEGIFLMNKTEKEDLIVKMNERAVLIKDKAFIEKSWDLFCESQKALYLPLLLGKGRVFNKLNRIFKNKLINCFYSRKKIMITHNVVRCESHDEVIQTVFNNYDNKK